MLKRMLEEMRNDAREEHKQKLERVQLQHAEMLTQIEAQIKAQREALLRKDYIIAQLRTDEGQNNLRFEQVIGGLQENILRLTTTNTEQEQRLREQAKRADMAERMFAETRERAAYFEHELEIRQAALREQAERFAASNANKDQRMLKMEEEHAKLLLKLDALRAGKGQVQDEMREELRDKDQELARLRVAVRENTARMEAEAKAVAELRENVAKLQKENINLTGKLDVLRGEQGQVQDEHLKVEAKAILELREHVTNLQNENNKLIDKLDVLRRKEAQGQDEQLSAKDLEIERLNAEKTQEILERTRREAEHARLIREMHEMMQKQQAEQRIVLGSL